jgi:aminopeptidase 2
MRSSHPLRVHIRSDDEIGQIFDDISYAKGACVLRMIASAVGQEIFLQGIRAYIRKYRYGNAKTEDLWSVLTEISGMNIGKLMHAWTQKVGFPMLLVTENVNSNTIHIRQTRFLMTEELLPGDDETIYPISLSLRTTAGVNRDTMLTTREGEFPAENLDFFKINADHTGFYRTAYSLRRLEKLGEAATRGLLSVEDRVGLIADVSALATAGYQRTSDLLSLLATLNMESEYIVWSQMLTSISDIGTAWMHVSQTQEALQAFERQIISEKAHKLHWIIDQNESSALRRLKALFFGRLALIKDTKPQKAASEMFARYCDGDQSAIHPDIRAAVFASVLSTGSRIEYDAVLHLYRTAKDSAERTTALTALGHTHDPVLVQRTTAMLLSPEVRLQDIQAPMASLGSHPIGIAALWNWITHNWPIIKERLSSGLMILPLVISLCTKGLTTGEQLRQAEEFFKKIETKGIDKALRQSLDEIRLKIRWVERDAENVHKWLEKYLAET